LKKKKQFQNDPKVIDIVKYCMELRLSEKEIVEKLATMGYPVCQRTVGRIKQKIPKPQRPDILAEEGLLQFVTESLDDFKEMEKTIDQIIKSSDNDYAIIRAIDTKTRIRKSMAEFYDSASVVAALSKRDNDVTIQKP